MASTFAFSILIATMVTTSLPSYIHSKTLESDTEVLRSIKLSIRPNSISSSSFLDTWNFDVDPCESSGGQFLGILCTTLDNSRSRIIQLDLESGGYDGFITPAIGNLTELTVLNLSKNKFRGTIPNNLFNLKKLTRLSLSENYFSAHLPRRINRLNKLEVLDLSYNNLSGSIPATIAGLRGLNLLRLSYNEFSGQIPDLSGLWQLRTLDLSSNQLYGNLPNLPQKLDTLVLSHNILFGHISSISKVEHIKSLDLSDNKFTGSVSRKILMSPKLNRLNLSNNQFSEIEVIKISDRVSELRVLDVHGNRLHGHLPMQLVTYANLTTINLGHNRFSGRIPIRYGEKLGRNWRNLFLDNNFLVGKLPQQFRGEVRIKGSLAKNCLSCPQNVQLCNGGQRPASECGRHNI